KRLAPSSNHKEGQIQSPGRHVLPASLYAQQLRERHAEQPNSATLTSTRKDSATLTSTGKPDPNPTETGKPDDPTPTQSRSQSQGGAAGDGKPTSRPEDPDGDLAHTGSDTPVGLLGGVATTLVFAGAAAARWTRRRRTARS
ncbi:hypothetical protein ACIOJ4_48700, partial [Streptomyces chartreusis]